MPTASTHFSLLGLSLPAALGAGVGTVPALVCYPIFTLVPSVLGCLAWSAFL